ncbi:MAG: acyltransferase [Muribaculaceae bacterium]|nr:acyltransferase [Muribaculaceae bacterium]
MFRYLNRNSSFVDTPRLSEAVRHRDGSRVFSLDLIRALAITLVIAEHTIPVNDPTSPWRWLSPVFAINAPLFFIISGALLLPVSRRIGTFIRRRASRVLIPFAFWSFIFAWLYYHFTDANIDFLASQIRWFWLRFTFPEAWFIPILLSMYLFYPVISPWIRTATLPRYRYFLILWAAALSLPFIENFSGDFVFNTSIFGTFYGCLGYAVAGVCLMRYPLLSSRGRQRRIAVIAILALIGFALPYIIIAVPKLYDTYGQRMSEAISVTTAAAAVLVFALLAPIKIKGHNLVRQGVTFIARISFPMYFIQPMLTRYVIPNCCPELMESNWLFPAVLVGSIIVAIPIRAIPLLRKFLG